MTFLTINNWEVNWFPLESANLGFISTVILMLRLWVHWELWCGWWNVGQGVCWTLVLLQTWAIPFPIFSCLASPSPSPLWMQGIASRVEESARCMLTPLVLLNLIVQSSVEVCPMVWWQEFCHATVRDVQLPYTLEALVSVPIKAIYANCNSALLPDKSSYHKAFYGMNFCWRLYK